MIWDEWLRKVVTDISEDQKIPKDLIHRLWQKIVEQLF